jgi:prefoldin alpha subunit
MAEREELARIAYEMQVYREQAQVLQQQLANLQLNYASLQSAIQTLESIGKLTDKEEVLLPIGSGAYVKAIIREREVALIDIGAGVIAEKPIPEAVKLLNSRAEESEAMREKIQKSFEEVSGKMAELEETANRIVGEMRKAKGEKESV